MFRTKILQIDSSKAKKYYNDEGTAFSFQLETPISVTSAESIVYSLVSAYIPYSFYSVNGNNNWLDIKEEQTGPNALPTSVRSVQIPDGNYSAFEFGRVLLALLNTGSVKYEVTYNKNSNTFLITVVSTAWRSTFLFETGEHASRSIHTFLGCPVVDIAFTQVPKQTGLVTMNDLYYFQIRTDIGSSDNFMTGDRKSVV